MKPKTALYWVSGTKLEPNCGIELVVHQSRTRRAYKAGCRAVEKRKINNQIKMAGDHPEIDPFHNRRDLGNPAPPQFSNVENFDGVMTARSERDELLDERDNWKTIAIQYAKIIESRS